MRAGHTLGLRDWGLLDLEGTKRYGRWSGQVALDLRLACTEAAEEVILSSTPQASCLRPYTGIIWRVSGLKKCALGTGRQEGPRSS